VMKRIFDRSIAFSVRRLQLFPNLHHQAPPV
jgi:hypothetical protein